MKSVGEVMAIGRTWEESLQKAIRQVDPRWVGFEAYTKPKEGPELDRALSVPTDMRLFVIAHAMYNCGYTVDRIHDLTKIDKVRHEAHRNLNMLTRPKVVPLQNRQHRPNQP